MGFMRQIIFLLLTLILIAGCQEIGPSATIDPNTPEPETTVTQIADAPALTPTQQAEPTQVTITEDMVDDTPSPPATATSAPVSTPTSIATSSPHLSPILQNLYPIYQETARLNMRDISGQLAVVPSPVYANGIYARDAFYTSLGLG